MRKLCYANLTVVFGKVQEFFTMKRDICGINKDLGEKDVRKATLGLVW